jgi:hypothetical protein
VGLKLAAWAGILCQMAPPWVMVFTSVQLPRLPSVMLWAVTGSLPAVVRFDTLPPYSLSTGVSHTWSYY